MEEEKEKKPKRKISKGMLYMRLIVSAYLVYLAYDIVSSLYFKDMGKGHVSIPLWVTIIVVILFVGVGLYAGITAIIALVKGNYDGGKNDVK